MSSTTLALAASPSGLRSRIAWRVFLAFAGSWLVAALAQIQITLPFTPVPITGQTLGVLLMQAAGFSLTAALEKGLAPFVVGDTLKLLAAAGLLPLAWRLVRKRSR